MSAFTCIISETGEFKIDTTGTYHGMTINSLTEDVPKPRSQAPVVAKQPSSTAPRNAVTNDKATPGGKPNRKGTNSGWHNAVPDNRSSPQIIMLRVCFQITDRGLRSLLFQLHPPPSSQCGTSRSSLKTTS